MHSASVVHEVRHPSSEHMNSPHEGWLARGAPMTAEQVPTLPLTSQASHCPLHARSQQTPSVQKPEWQSAAVTQLLEPDRLKLPATVCGAVTLYRLKPLPFSSTRLSRPSRVSVSST